MYRRKEALVPMCEPQTLHRTVKSAVLQRLNERELTLAFIHDPIN